MGAILTPDAAMGAWAVEVRRESAYLNGDLGGYNAWTHDEQAEPPRHTAYAAGDGFAIVVDDIAAVMAAVDQVMAHRSYRAWATENDHTPGVWSPELVDDRLVLHGPAIVAGDPEPGAPLGSVEVPYTAMLYLRALLDVWRCPRPEEERAWREHSVESGCRIAEGIVADKRVPVVGAYVLAFAGFAVLSLAVTGFFGESLLFRLVTAILGGFMIGVGFSNVGRYNGQRQMVGWWRESLDRPMPSVPAD